MGELGYLDYKKWHDVIGKENYPITSMSSNEICLWKYLETYKK